MKEKLLVVKIGGNVIESEIDLDAFLKDFAARKEPKILVHGGGRSATKLATKLGIPTEIIDGRRVTTADNLKVVVQTYAGWVNTSIVGKLQKHGCNALGLSGADANIIQATKRPERFVNYGFVGDVQHVDADMLNQFIKIGITPVCCAVTHDGSGQLLNTNADTIASSIAVALAKLYRIALFYCFELPGVLRDIKDHDSLIENLNLETYTSLRDAQLLSDGMLPKLQNCFDALQQKVDSVRIGSTAWIRDNKVKHTRLSLEHV